MPIVGVAESKGFPIVGKIRLGVKKQTAKGGERPETKPYFVLADAPDVARIYGEEPTEIDCFFLSDDEESSYPYYYKLFSGGYTDKQGNKVGGRLQCQGDGRTAKHYAARDPLTRVVPERQCLVQDCPDWKNSKGQQQCKQHMNVFVWVPLANLGGVYQVDTTSWYSINSFVKQTDFFRKAFKKLSGIPFKIVRVPKNIDYTDPKTGREYKSTQYIMELHHNPDFWDRCGEQLKADVQKLLGAGQELFQAPPQTAIEHTQTEPGYIPYDGESEEQLKSAEQEEKIEKAAQIAESEDVLPLFEKLAQLRGVKSTSKNRLLTARKFEDKEDPLGALKEYLENKIKEAEALAQPQPETSTTTQPQQDTTKEADHGLI